MANDPSRGEFGRPHCIVEPSVWVRRFAPLIAGDTSVLDVACGSGRHTWFFLSRGNSVVAIDRNTEPVRDAGGDPKCEVIEANLENGDPWPLTGRTFGAIVVVNYLFRPLMPVLLESLEAGGVLIYETFARGNETYTRPRNPDHLLKTGELLEWVQGKLQVVGFESGLINIADKQAVVQRICAVNNLGPGKNAPEDAPPCPLPPG